MQLEGKVALVTGAGSGIGKAAAILFAREGAKVGALSHTTSEVEQTAQEIRDKGGEAIALTADVSQPDQMKAATDQLAGHYGRLDIVFANAGINGVWAPIEELAPEEWDATLAVNLKGTFLTIKYAVPYLKQQGGGSVIVTSSINGTRAFSNTGSTAYSCSKGGQVVLTKMLALELAPQNIRVNVICPGAIETEIGENTQMRDIEHVRFPREYPAGEIPLYPCEPGTSEEVAQLALFLASDASAHITGTPIWIDGAESLLIG